MKIPQEYYDHIDKEKEKMTKAKNNKIYFKNHLLTKNGLDKGFVDDVRIDDFQLFGYKSGILKQYVLKLHKREQGASKDSIRTFNSYHEYDVQRFIYLRDAMNFYNQGEDKK
jgi:hypothetical protein